MKMHLVVVGLGKVGQQERDDLHGLAASLRQPCDVAGLVELLDGLELEVAVRVAVIGGADAVGERGHAAGVEHPHHHRRARARQARDDDDGRAGPQRRSQAAVTRRLTAGAAPLCGGPIAAERLPLPMRTRMGDFTTRALACRGRRCRGPAAACRPPWPTSAPAPASRCSRRSSWCSSPLLVVVASVLAWPFRALWRLVRGNGPPQAPIGRLIVVGFDGQDPGAHRSVHEAKACCRTSRGSPRTGALSPAADDLSVDVAGGVVVVQHRHPPGAPQHLRLPRSRSPHLSAACCRRPTSARSSASSGSAST